MKLKPWSLLCPGSQEKDRRKAPRTALHDSALLMFLTGETDVLQRAHVLDISLSGVCFQNVEPVRGFARDQERINIEQLVMASFENYPLIVFGTLKRIEDGHGRVALQVRRSTNFKLWKELCVPRLQAAS